MKKTFKEDGDLFLYFAVDAKDQIIKWLDGIDYGHAIKYAKVVKCSVFGEAVRFPCVIVNF